MTSHDRPKYACPHCGETEFCTLPDSYAIYRAEGGSLHFTRTELTNEKFLLYCRECGEKAPAEFVGAAH